MTVSNEYKQLLKEAHKNKKWGTRDEIPDQVVYCIENFDIKSILDFGCGKGHVKDLIKEKYPNIEVYGYDPGFDSSLPEKVDLIYSTDVLEHIEPEELDNTLNDLNNRTNILQYHLIACHRAKAKLPDGRNAHLIQEPPDWWQRKIKEYNWEVLYEESYSFVKQMSKDWTLAQTYYEILIKK